MIAKLTYGEGAVGVFPRGAIKHPSLLASACVLFDSITILKPTDIQGERPSPRDLANWRYRLRPNPEADDFWLAVQPLVDRGVLHPFLSQIDLSTIESLHDRPELTSFGIDQFDYDFDKTVQTRLFAVGFTEYFQFLGANGLPLVLSGPELHDVTSLPRPYSAFDTSQLSGDSVRMLGNFIPLIETVGCTPIQLITNLIRIREHLEDERSAFTSLVGRLSTLTAEEPDTGLGGAILDQICLESVDAWEAYRSKLMELASRSFLPVKFIPLTDSLVTLDQIACGKHLSDALGKALADSQKRQMIAFIWRVNQVSNYWG